MRQSTSLRLAQRQLPQGVPEDRRVVVDAAQTDGDSDGEWGCCDGGSGQQSTGALTASGQQSTARRHHFGTGERSQNSSSRPVTDAFRWRNLVGFSNHSNRHPGRRTVSAARIHHDGRHHDTVASRYVSWSSSVGGDGRHTSGDGAVEHRCAPRRRELVADDGMLFASAVKQDDNNTTIRGICIYIKGRIGCCISLFLCCVYPDVLGTPMRR